MWFSCLCLPNTTFFFLSQGLRDRLRPHLGPGNQVAPERRAEILEWADDDGRTALVVAAAKDHKGIVELVSSQSFV